MKDFQETAKIANQVLRVNQGFDLVAACFGSPQVAWLAVLLIGARPLFGGQYPDAHCELFDKIVEEAPQNAHINLNFKG